MGSCGKAFVSQTEKAPTGHIWYRLSFGKDKNRKLIKCTKSWISNDIKIGYFQSITENKFIVLKTSN